jgi:ATP-binding cassette subfamily F protein 3
MHINLNTKGRSGDLVLRTHSLQVGYHDEGRPLFDCPDLVLLRQECAAIIGPNGAGKTTFLKTILEQIPPYAGATQLGASLEIGYFAQAHEGLNPSHSLMQEINAAAPQLLPAEVRNFLAKFLFTGDDVFRKVSTLSGGERGRLALAKLSLSDANLLLLDEPTNHLDLPTQEVLESVLSAFPGTILLVSHDRYLIDSLATQIWEVEPQGQRMQVYKGSYTQFKAYKLKKQEEQAEVEKASQGSEAEKPAPRETRPQAAKSLSKYERKKLQSRLTAIETELQSLETQQAATSARLETPPDDPDEVLRLGEEYMGLQQKMEGLLAEWGQIEEQLSAD